MTSIQTVFEAVRTPIVAAAVAANLPYVIDNTPPDDFSGLWLRVETTVDNVTTVTHVDRYRYSGTLTVALFAPRATGDLVVAQAAETLVALYRTFRSSSPIVQVQSASLVGAAEYADGYAGRTVRVLWFADVLTP